MFMPLTDQPCVDFVYFSHMLKKLKKTLLGLRGRHGMENVMGLTV